MHYITFYIRHIEISDSKVGEMSTAERTNDRTIDSGACVRAFIIYIYVSYAFWCNVHIALNRMKWFVVVMLPAVCGDETIFCYHI